MEKKQAKYQDMIDYKHPVSKVHARMSLHDRAAQFAPFAALTGHNDAIKETARLTQRKIELSEEEKEQLNLKLSQILCNPQKKEQVSITYFLKDLQKEGGTYLTVTGTIKKVDTVGHKLIMEDHTTILLEDISHLDTIDP